MCIRDRYYFGLVWVVLVISLGSRSVNAAINGGVSFIILPALLTQIGLSTPVATGISFIFFGFGAITYAKHPEGVIEANTRKSVERLMRRRNKGAPDDAPPASPVEPLPLVDAVPTPVMAPAPQEVES